MKNNLVGPILEELEQILEGKSRITPKNIEKEGNEDYKQILTALFSLKEDLEFSNKRKEEVVVELMESKKQCEKGSQAKADFLSKL